MLDQEATTDTHTATQSSMLVHHIAALAAAQMQGDWSGMAALLKDVQEDDLPLYGNVAAEMVAQCAHWDVRALDDGGDFDAVPRPIRAAAIAIAQHNYDRARVMARGRCTPSEAAWVMCLAWNAVSDDPAAALDKAQLVCRASAQGVRLVATNAA